TRIGVPFLRKRNRCVPRVEPLCNRVGSRRGSYRDEEEQAFVSLAVMEPAPNAGQAFFPLDEQLALSKGGSLTPKQEEHLVHLAAWMPFARAGQMLSALLGVQVSK